MLLRMFEFIKPNLVVPDLEIFAVTQRRQKNRRKVGLISRPTTRKVAAKGRLGLSCCVGNFRMDLRFIASCVFSFGTAASLHFVPGDWPASKVTSVDILATLLVSLLCPCLLGLVRHVDVARMSWTVLGWLWLAMLIRQTVLAVSLPKLVNRDLTIGAVAVWNSSVICLAMDLLSLRTRRTPFERFKCNHLVVKKVEGTILRLTPSTVVAPKGCCAICMQALRPPNRSASTRALSVSRLRPRINAGNLKCHGTSQVLQTNCLHFFHVSCIAKWVRMSLNTSNCPVCSRPITD